MGRFFDYFELKYLRQRRISHPFPYTRNWLMDTGDPVYLYGAGVGDFFAFNNLVDQGSAGKLAGFLDNNPDKVTYCGLPVFSPEYPSQQSENPLAVITLLYDTRQRNEIVRDCQSKGYRYIHIPELLSNLSFPQLSADDLENNPSAAASLDVWVDETSELLYRKLMRRIYGKLPEDIFYGNPHNQYISGHIPKKYYKNFLDCGPCDHVSYHHIMQFVGYDFLCCGSDSGICGANVPALILG